MKIRYGCHHFINVQPFIYPLANRLVDHNFELIFDTPAGIATRLKKGTLDIAFIPSIEYAGSDYLLIPDHSISSKGPVSSVLLCSKKKIEDIESIALDERSKTSIAMLKILLNKKYTITPKCITMKPDIATMLNQCDSALIIGDSALTMNKEGYIVYDLGEEWYSYTQTTFVHAVLAARPGVDLGNSLDTLRVSKKIGLANRKKIAKDAPLNYDRCLTYLTDIIRYDLGDEEVKGLQCFFSLAAECKIIPTTHEIRMYDKAPARKSD